MDVDAPDLIDKETMFSPPAAMGNEDANAETAEDGSTNGEARPATMDVEAQAGSKHTRDEDEKDDPLTAILRKTLETTRRIKENKKKAQMQSTLRLVAAVLRWGHQSLHQ